MLKVGLIGTEQVIVNLSKCASEVGSGDLEVFSTPALCAVMEGAAINSLSGLLPYGKTTVGASIDIRHLSPTPTGMTVFAKSELVEVDGSRLVFQITAFDKAGVIGTATHERRIIDRAPFLDKAEAKRHL